MKISSKKVCEKMENNSTLEKVLLAYNRNFELLRSSRSNLSVQSGLPQKDKKENLDKENFALFVCRLLTFELSNIN